MIISDEQMAEIRRAVNHEPQPTRRPVVPDMEDLLFKPWHILDHGFVRVVDYMGDDAAVVQAARVSYGAGTKAARDDQGLINYLMRHRHTTPFEMCEIKLHVKLPIFVARQWIRHRTANVNEYSARYSILDKEFYFPNEDELRQQSSRNKQGSEGSIDPEVAREWLHDAVSMSDYAYGRYSKGIETQGIAREMARMNLPLNIYTQWYWKVDVHNLLHFLDLRTDSHAQKEIRDYADKIAWILSFWLPMVHQAWVNYRQRAVTFSSGQIWALQQMIQIGHRIPKPDDMSTSEWDEVNNFYVKAKG